MPDVVSGTKTWEAWRDEEQIRAQLPAMSHWRHVKRGTTYVVHGIALHQDATGSGEHDMQLVVIYWSEDRGRLCTRRVSEFLDGRYERIGM